MRALIAVILTGLCLGGCNGGPEPRDYGEFQKPSRLLEKEIQDRIAALEYQSRVRLTRNLDRLAYIGEPAVPYLLEGLNHASPLTRGSCAKVLGDIRDLRTLEDLRRVAKADDMAMVRYEAAAALVAIGDKAHGYPVLVEGLADEDISNRYNCFKVLRLKTVLTFGYAHDGEPAKRAKAVEQWRAWVTKTYP